MNNITEILREELSHKGAITFARFMEVALYCPNFGYYEQLTGSPGRHGDFFTSVSVGSLFGEMLAAQFAVWLEALPVQPRQIVESGAHDGKLASDILRWLRQKQPALADSVEYWILEPSARRREAQQATLKEFGGAVRWFESWDALPKEGVNGVIFANELLDAMPVHRLGWNRATQSWFEWGVVLKTDGFAWAPLSGAPEQDVESVFGKLPPELLKVLPNAFTTEICPSATAWWRQAARTLKAGKLIALDYGLTAEQFFMPNRRGGTIRAYYRHQYAEDVLARPGEQDITAQVNFTVIGYAGKSEGLTTHEWTTQSRFLTGVLAALGEKSLGSQEWDQTRTRQFQTLTHPEHLGQSFQVLVQSR